LLAYCSAGSKDCFIVYLFSFGVRVPSVFILESLENGREFSSGFICFYSAKRADGKREEKAVIWFIFYEKSSKS
jgi:hypothetical protein